MILGFVIIGIILSVILLFNNARRCPSSVYLSLFFLLISVYVFNLYVIVYSKSVFLVSLFYLNAGFLFYLLGPLFYWYVRSVLTDNYRLKESDIWHFIPTLVFFIITVPYLFCSWSYKVEAATRIVNDISYLPTLKPTFLYSLLPSVEVFLSRPVLVLGYVIWSLVLFIRYRKNKRKTMVSSNQYHMMEAWFILFFCCMLVLAISHGLTILGTYLSLNFHLFYTLNVLQVLSAIGLLGLLISPFFFPYILYGLPRFSDLSDILNPMACGSVPINDETGKSRPDFESDYLCFVGQQVESLMARQQPYLQSDCNIGSFSKLLNIPAHHVAYYFREVRKQSFNDFRNAWRVRHAKNLIIEGKTNEITMEAIGSLSGFSSKNTFFTAFKKVEKITPGAYALKISPLSTR